MQSSRFLSLFVGGMLLLASVILGQHEHSARIAGVCLFLCGIIVGWWSRGGSVVPPPAVSSPTPWPQFSGVYRDPQTGEQWDIRDAGIVSVRKLNGDLELRGWVENSVLTVQFRNRTVSGTLKGQELVWRSNAIPWVKCAE